MRGKKKTYAYISIHQKQLPEKGEGIGGGNRQRLYNETCAALLRQPGSGKSVKTQTTLAFHTFEEQKKKKRKKGNKKKHPAWIMD